MKHSRTVQTEKLVPRNGSVGMFIDGR
jgi:hypothetical protein